MVSSSKKTVFHVTARSADQKTKQLRNQGKIPANVYGLKKDSEAVTLDRTGFIHLYDEVGDTGLIYVKIGDTKEQPVLIDEVALDSVTADPIHVAFKRVNLKVAVQAAVPIELIGENDIHDTIVTQVKQDVEVEALPADLPEKFEVDISTLTEVGQMVTLADLSFDTSKVTLVLGEDVDPASETVVVLQAVQEEVVEEEPTDETLEGETSQESETSTDTEGAEETTEEKAE